ncbi:helix-turn-helix protein [Rhodoglobus vestalii]|uniref:Helix-turn-helix protein n=1 Tax=Rhodoglobus vestalii TaxID=193384 RepID=A0A8H2PXJ6_9MICO|nr:helix-turn-helix transcriptional regulator [Rhodoglobus vestalii]TQO20320.1 helix-turn-helix protein [Rhodoglobus vestalii]
MPETVSYNPGERIAHYRKLAKLSAEELAERAGFGLTRSIIANLENGRKEDLTVRQLIAVAFVLGVTPAALVFDLLDPYGYSTLIETETDTIQTQNWLAYNWFGGEFTPSELVVKTLSEDAVDAPALEDDNWTVHYLLKQRASLLWALGAQTSLLSEMETNARAHGSFSQLLEFAEYKDAKAKIRDFSAELYSIDGQLRSKYKVLIDKPITHPRSPFD